MQVIQFLSKQKRKIGVIDSEGFYVYCVEDAEYLYDLALEAILNKVTLKHLISKRLSSERFVYDELIENQLILLPIDHLDPSHAFVTGTGLTHNNSINNRVGIHSHFSDDILELYRNALEKGKLNNGFGARPEWFFKGNGYCIKPNRADLYISDLSLGCGEEAEIIAIYLKSPFDNSLYRIGYSLGNEFSDHNLEKSNRLYLAQSKLMPCSIGPEILIDELPNKIEGHIEIKDKDKIIWSQKFTTGKGAMSYSIENIENYLFQNEIYHNPGGVYYHFLGADKLSYSDAIIMQNNYIVKIEASCFMRPLINTIKVRTRINQKIKSAW